MQTPAKVPPEYLRHLSWNIGVVTEPLTVSCHRKLYARWVNLYYLQFRAILLVSMTYIGLLSEQYRSLLYPI